MLKKIKRALLLSDVKSFSDNFKLLAEDIGVSLSVEAEWNSRYRINADTVIFGSKYINDVNEIYYPLSVVILKENESPAQFIKMGITRFIFNYKNNYELICALHKAEAEVINVSQVEYEDMVQTCNVTDFCFADYDFKFSRNQFKYKGRLIYLTNSEKKYLAQWLLNGIKDNSKRMMLCNMRKRFDADFLKDINRYGILKGGKNE